MYKNNPVIQKLLSLDLPVDDFAVFGSGTMFAYGIQDLGNDIDLIARGKAWEKAMTLGAIGTTKSGGHTVVTVFEGAIEIFNVWAPGEWNTDELIDNAEIIEGIRFVGLDTVIKWKKIRGKKRDFEHIKMIEDYLAQN